MYIKMEDARANEKDAKYDMVQKKIELRKLQKENSIAEHEFQSLVDREWNKKWKIKNKYCKEKINWLKSKQDAVFKRINIRHLQNKMNQKSKNVHKKLDQKLSMNSLDKLIERVDFKATKNKVEDNSRNKFINLGYDGINVNMEKFYQTPQDTLCIRKCAERMLKCQWKKL